MLVDLYKGLHPHILNLGSMWGKKGRRMDGSRSILSPFMNQATAVTPSLRGRLIH